MPVFRRFGLGAVLSYLAAGLALGPHGWRFVGDAEPVLTASESASGAAADALSVMGARRHRT